VWGTSHCLRYLKKFREVKAEACEANGDLAGILSVLERAIALDPKNAEYQHARTLLQESVR
jgi:hypothetical protein